MHSLLLGSAGAFNYDYIVMAQDVFPVVDTLTIVYPFDLWSVAWKCILHYVKYLLCLNVFVFIVESHDDVHVSVHLHGEV